jgi:selenocysteine lyase/cysteine desulfurase
MAEVLSTPPVELCPEEDCCPEVVEECRQRLARLFGVPEPARVVLTPGAAFSLECALRGIVQALGEPAHCLCSVLEHGSVLQALRHHERAGRLRLDLLSAEELLCHLAIEGRFRPETRVVALTAASHVTGQAPDLIGIGRLCQQHDAILLIDAAQAAGSIPLDLSLLPDRTLVAVSGHKGLYGPQGVGALLVGPGFSEEELLPFIRCGLGGPLDAKAEGDGWPVGGMAGSVNFAGYAGLSEGIGFVLEQGVDSLAKHKHHLVTQLIDLFCGVPGISLYAAPEGDYRCGLLSFNLEPWDPRELSQALREEFGIAAGGGLHCAPLIHRALGCPQGSVRVGVGYLNSEEEMVRLARAVGRLAGRPALVA